MSTIDSAYFISNPNLLAFTELAANLTAGELSLRVIEGCTLFLFSAISRLISKSASASISDLIWFALIC